MAISNAEPITAPSDNPISCPFCDGIIKHARNLQRHVFKRHLPAAQKDMSPLLAITNAVTANAPSDNPVECPFCQDIIKHARNLRRHVFKRHLPAAQKDVSALVAIANAVSVNAPSDNPIKCPICGDIIKHARNLRRHVLKRHLPAVQRGEIMEEEVKDLLEKKIKMIAVTPLTEEELLSVQNRIRRRGLSSKLAANRIVAISEELNESTIDSSEILEAKMTLKEETISTSQESPSQILADGSRVPHEEMLPEASRAYSENNPQEGVMNLATSQNVTSQQALQQCSSVPVSASPQASAAVVPSSPSVALAIPVVGTGGVNQSARLHSNSQRDNSMHLMGFDSQTPASQNVTYNSCSTSSSQTGQQTSATTAPAFSGYIPGTYWTAPGMAGFPGPAFQPHQSMLTPAHAEYFTAGIHMVRHATLDRSQQHRRKPY